MPIIAPSPTGVDPALYYSAVTAATTFQVTTAAHLGLKMTLANVAYSPLIAMVGGLVTFLPTGKPLPTADATPSPGTGSLYIKTHLPDVHALRKKLPPGVPPPTKVLYLNVKPTAVRNVLQPVVQALLLADLKSAWNKPSAMPDRAGLESNYLDRIMLGEKAVFVPGGTLIGQAERIDPTNTASDFEMTLRFTDGTGNDLSPLLHLRSMPDFGARWVGHPLVTATANTPVPVNIYLQFEVWDETASTHPYVPLPPGVAVDLMDYDSGSPNDKLATQITDAQGRVHFSIPDIQILDEPEPDIFFLVHTNQLSHAGHTLPQEWSTKGWKDKNGLPGYYENFKGTQLGDAANPLTFRIGVDFHASFEYSQFNPYTPSGYSPTSTPNHIAPAGIPVSIYTGSESPFPQKKRQMKTNEKGEVHGVIFDVDAEASIDYFVEFEMTDTTINLPRAKVMMAVPGWRTFFSDADKRYYPDNDRTSLGSFSAPDIFHCSADERDVALYFLKILRELTTFLFNITGGAWTGINNLQMFRHAAFNHPYSWPVGDVNIPGEVSITGGGNYNYHWDRDTIIHELSHQVMWKEVGFSSTKIALEFGPLGELHGKHSYNSLFNYEHALIEGWAEFIAAIFEGFTSPSAALTTILDGSGPATISGGLGPPPFNRGEEIEGAFAKGLWAIFKKHVVTLGVSSTARVPNSVNGDVTTTAPWISNPSVQGRFLSMIWNPLKDLMTLSDPTTSDMHDKIRARNPAEWHKLMAELQEFNQAMAVPTAHFGSISPLSGPAAGGQLVTITGTNFIATTVGTIGGQPIETLVTIGGAPATNISVISSTKLTAVTPAGAPGNATLVITTPAGSATVPNVYAYV
jgi:hypothetical protein